MTSAEITGAAPEDATAGAAAVHAPDEAVSAHEVTVEQADPGAPARSPSVLLATSDSGWLRLSPRSMVVRPLTDLVRLVPLLAGLLILHSDTGGGVIWTILAAAAAVMTGLVHWGTTRYRITSERVYLRRGLLNQKVLSVARDRVRTVDVTAHLLHRVLGVCRISIGTGRNDLRSSESFQLDGLTRSAAESLRVLLLAGASGVGAGFEPPPELSTSVAVAGGPASAHTGRTTEDEAAARPGWVSRRLRRVLAGSPVPLDRGRELAKLRISWLRFAPLTMTGLVVLSVLFGALIQISNVANINLGRSSQVRLIVGDFAALDIVQRVLVGGAAAMAGYVLIALIGYIAVYWDFRLARHGTDTVRVTRGLLSVRATTISLAGCAASRSASRCCSGRLTARGASRSPRACTPAGAPSTRDRSCSRRRRARSRAQ